jgi:predicted nucleotidyltransferase
MGEMQDEVFVGFGRTSVPFYSTIVLEMRTASVPNILLGKTRQAVLSLLILQPQERFYLREIARRLALSPGATQRELSILLSCKLILRDRHGFFIANAASPWFDPLQRLLQVAVATHSTIADAIEPFADQIRCAFVFGSFARAEAHSQSDLDLFVLSDGSLQLPELVQFLVPAQRTMERDINPFLISVDDFRERLRANNPFLRRVLSGEKIFLIGDQHELDQLAEERVAAASHARQDGNRRPARHRAARSQGQPNPGPE